MGTDHRITRRQALKQIITLSGGVAAGSLIPAGRYHPLMAARREDGSGWLVEGVARKEPYSVEELTRKVFEAAGGIGRFIAPGQVVAIKPNVSWARPPHLAATTNPQVLQALVHLCQEAGAKKVRIADHTIHDARRCFAITGVGAVAKETGAELVFPRSSLMKEMRLQGHRLDVWPVYRPLIEADTVINLPVAKHHSLSSLTLGMKNWIGAVGGSRWSLHQDIHQTIVDLAQFFRPALTLIDATRILVKNGPSGGSPEDVLAKHTLILSNDPVAADAQASKLFGIEPVQVGHIRLAEKWGLGTSQPESLHLTRVLL